MQKNRLDSFKAAQSAAGHELLDVLQARQGLVCLVGAGGKKTTLYALASRHTGRIGITTTVRLPPFPRSLSGARVIAPPEELADRVAEAALAHRIVAFAHPASTDYRVQGVSAELLQSIQKRVGFDLLLVKADGARQRLIKAPAPYEPVLPPDVSTILPLVSARAIGQPLSERVAHRIDRLEAVTGARRGEPIRPIHIARLLASDEGLLKNAGSERLIPIINQVDDAEREVLAAEAARQALELTDGFDQVVLASMRRSDPVIDIIRR